MEDARPNQNSSSSPSSPSSLKGKLKSSLRRSCCLPTNQPQTVDSVHKPVKSSSVMAGAGASQILPEIKDRLVSHFRGPRQSSQFRYDPLSYSLNFDQGLNDNDADLYQSRNFAARLPPTPPPEGEPHL